MTGPVSVSLVLGSTAGGTGTHVRMLAGRLARRGIAVDVAGPSATSADFGFGALEGVRFHPVEFGDRPRIGDAVAVLRLRRLLTARGGQSAGERSVDGPDVAHAHGMRAGALTVLALAGRRRPPLVVTVHNAPPVTGRAARYVYLALERIVARGAGLVLCVSGDLEERMRRAGARRVARAVVPAAVRGDATDVTGHPLRGRADDGRPVILAVGRLAPQKGLDVLLRAAASWRDIDPRPRVVIAGTGPLDSELRRQAGELGVDAEFAGWRDDVPALLAAASVFVLPSLWEGQPLILAEALRAGVPIVASRAGGIPDLVGDDAAVLVPPGEPGPLAAAVREVLGNPARANRLRAAARDRAVKLPTDDDAVTAVLASYATVLQ